MINRRLIILVPFFYCAGTKRKNLKADYVTAVHNMASKIFVSFSPKPTKQTTFLTFYDLQCSLCTFMPLLGSSLIVYYPLAHIFTHVNSVN